MNGIRREFGEPGKIVKPVMYVHENNFIWNLYMLALVGVSLAPICTFFPSNDGLQCVKSERDTVSYFLSQLSFGLLSHIYTDIIDSASYPN